MRKNKRFRKENNSTWRGKQRTFKRDKNYSNITGMYIDMFEVLCEDFVKPKRQNKGDVPFKECGDYGCISCNMINKELNEGYFHELISQYSEEIDQGDYNSIYFYTTKWLYNKFIGGHFLKDGNKRTYRGMLEVVHKTIKEKNLK